MNFIFIRVLNIFNVFFIFHGVSQEKVFHEFQKHLESGLLKNTGIIETMRRHYITFPVVHGMIVLLGIIINLYLD